MSDWASVIFRIGRNPIDGSAGLAFQQRDPFATDGVDGSTGLFDPTAQPQPFRFGNVRALSVKSVVDSNYSINDTARGNVIAVDPVVWKELVRGAYQAFNAGIVAELVKAKK